MWKVIVEVLVWRPNYMKILGAVWFGGSFQTFRLSVWLIGFFKSNAPVARVRCNFIPAAVAQPSLDVFVVFVWSSCQAHLTRECVLKGCWGLSRWNTTTHETKIPVFLQRLNFITFQDYSFHLRKQILLAFEMLKHSSPALLLLQQSLNNGFL